MQQAALYVHAPFCRARCAYCDFNTYAGLESLIPAYVAAVCREIESAGGIVRAVSEGFIQRKIAAQAYREELAIKKGEIVRVGVNKYVMEEESHPVEIYRHDESMRARQIEKLRKVKSERDGGQVRRCLGVLREKAGTRENLMPFIKDAVRAYTTVGEITGVFKEVFGEFKEPKI